jgi:hypothetical protein
MQPRLAAFPYPYVEHRFGKSHRAALARPGDPQPRHVTRDDQPERAIGRSARGIGRRWDSHPGWV